MSRDLHSLLQKLADTQAKVIELEQRIDALQTSAGNATTAADHRVDILQSSTENATQAAVSEPRRLEHDLSQCYVLLNEFAQFLSQQPSNHFQFPQQQQQEQPQPQPQPSFELSAVFTDKQFTLSTATTTSTTTPLRPVDESSEPNEPSQSSECCVSTRSNIRVDLKVFWQTRIRRVPNTEGGPYASLRCAGRPGDHHTVPP